MSSQRLGLKACGRRWRRRGSERRIVAVRFAGLQVSCGEPLFLLQQILDDGKPASAKSVHSYIVRAFGDRLGDARGAMEALAASLPPEELNRVGFRLYERFRPDVPEGAQSWGAKGELQVERIVGAAG